MKIGAMIAHFGITPGMMMSITNTSRMKPTSSGSAPMSACPSGRPASWPAIARHVGVVEVRDELRDQQHQEDQPAEAVEGLDDRVDDVRAAGQAAGALAVAEARGQEQHRDDEEQAAHERRVAEDLAGVRVAQRARSAGTSAADDDRHRHQQCRSPDSRSPRDSCDSSSPLGTWSTGASAGRSAGSHLPEPRLDVPLGEDGHHDRAEDRRGDREVEVAGDVEGRRVGRDAAHDLVGDLGDDAVGRGDQNVAIR